MIAFKSEAQRRLFDTVTSEIEGLGYRGELLCRGYPFSDWFEPGDITRVAPVAAFGRTPTTYDTACLAIALSNGRFGPKLISDFRTLGATRVFEVHENRVSVWRVNTTIEPADELLVVPAEQLRSIFRDHADSWRAESVLRAKEMTTGEGDRQLDFFDVGLITALEGHIRIKLGDLLKESLAKAARAYNKSLANMDPEETQQLFRLVFRFLAAKVLQDRGVGEFAGLSASSGSEEILEKAGRYYGRNDAVMANTEVRDAVKTAIWSRLNLQNLSVEVLAYVYEFTLVSHSLRKRLGIHGTPPSIARYIVRNLPIDSFPLDSLQIVEPCSGHAVFLVAAIQRLRELLPPDIDPGERHKYLVGALRGFELDAFALEVSLLCLMLADFPNPNGWQITNADVFASTEFVASLKHAKVVLCNPPYEDIPVEKREAYGERRSVHKPDEVIHRVLDDLHPDGVLGFVLPRRILDDSGSMAIRRRLAERFEEIEIVELPESKVFYISEHPSVLVLAKRPSRGSGLVSLTTTVLEKTDQDRFLNRYSVVRRDVNVLTVDAAAGRLFVTALQEIWTELRRNGKLGSIAEIHVGLEWRPKGEGERRYSDVQEPGFEKGYARADAERLFQYTPPAPAHLNVGKENLRWNTFQKYDWRRPKVFVNAIRTTRKGAWRHVAFIDDEGLYCSENFLGVWPRDSSVPVEVLAAILNSPVAAAFIKSNEGAKRNSIGVLRDIPIPVLSTSDRETLKALVRTYLDSRLAEQTLSKDAFEDSRRALLRIDGLILKAYDLPPHLERNVLDFFDGSTRPVPFPFTGYDLEEFLPLRILANSDDPRAEWALINGRRIELIDKEADGDLAQSEQDELERLQRETGKYANIMAPLPFDFLGRLEERARQLGLEFEREESL